MQLGWYDGGNKEVYAEHLTNIRWQKYLIIIHGPQKHKHMPSLRMKNKFVDMVYKKQRKTSNNPY
jgi:hypothetical protein